MQYVKSTRLHQARLLMVRDDLTAEAAGHAVGYVSPSQFNPLLLLPRTSQHIQAERFAVCGRATVAGPHLNRIAEPDAMVYAIYRPA
ncbi:MAG: hypothetical protein KGQ57_14950 [Burkholderiales bacterium]|nr:hypothetical protein [Burkholderiales bacterium]